MSRSPISLQDQFGSQGVCFGCGPKNERGLQLKSFVESDQIVAEWMPKPGFEGFENMMNGGIIASLMDCHSNWAAAWYLMQSKQLDRPLSTVTGRFSITYLQPTIMTDLVHLYATLKTISESRVDIETKLHSQNKNTAIFSGTFIAVKPDHPAYNQWTTGHGRAWS